MRITAKLLDTHDACESQVAVFRKTFPRGTKVTLAAIAKARKVGLSVEWIAELLPASARKVRDAATAPAYKVFNAAIADARKVRDAATADALVEAFKETP